MIRLRARQNLNKVIELTKADFNVRYRNTFFGCLWSVISPLLLLVSLYIVFSIVMKLDIENYQIFLLIGIIVWNFFVESTTLSMNSLISKADLIKKMKFPIGILVLSSCLNSLINLLMSSIILVAMMVFFRIRLSPAMLPVLFYVFLLFVLALGISYLLSAFYLFFRDLTHIWSFLTLIGFWITPIIYSETQIPLIYRGAYMLNPLARLINHIRDILLNNYFSLEQTVITVIICYMILIVGIYFFNRHSSSFAEEL